MQTGSPQREELDFWLRHRDVGVSLGIVLPALGIAHALTDAGQTRLVAVLVVNAVVIALSPLMLLVPLERVLARGRAQLLFETWELVGLCVVTLLAALDGGVGSPYITSYYVLVAHAALTFPPSRVAVAGGVATASYLGLAVTSQGQLAHVGYVAATLAVTTVTCAAASSSHGRAYRRKAEEALRAEALADRDGLSGCLNHRAFRRRLHAAAAVADESGPMSLLLLDVDDFKAVNDTLGHLAGDEVIRELGRALGEVSRATDLAGRLGGDEFALLMPGTDAGGARRVADRLRARLAESPQRVTASIGVVTTTASSDGTALIAAADRATYQAKRAGKDAVVVAEGLR